MKVLFSIKGNGAYLADKERLIFGIDNYFYDASGNEVPFELNFSRDLDECDNSEWWQEDRVKYQDLEQPLIAASTTEIKWEIDDGFGNFGFRNKTGEFVIEPQYAYAHDFTHGLASVNLNRTWYKTEDGDRYYENHFGYINERGQTIIGFQFDEASQFNKYGVAVVSDIHRGTWLIDTEGNEIPGTHFPHLSRYLDYNERFIEFSYDHEDDFLIGIYDTKDRKVLTEPSFESFIELDENLILILEHPERSEISDFHEYYINSKGELLFPWLYNKGFSSVKITDANNVTAVAVSKHTEQQEHLNGYFPHSQNNDNCIIFYGLYSSKEMFILPPEYDDIKSIGENLWMCLKDDTVTIVQTESTD